MPAGEEQQIIKYHSVFLDPCRLVFRALCRQELACCSKTSARDPIRSQQFTRKVLHTPSVCVWHTCVTSEIQNATFLKWKVAWFSFYSGFGHPRFLASLFRCVTIWVSTQASYLQPHKQADERIAFWVNPVKFYNMLAVWGRYSFSLEFPGGESLAILGAIPYFVG